MREGLRYAIALGAAATSQ